MTTDLLVPTAERTLRLIELLLDHPDGLTPQEMLPQLELSRSSLFLLLGTLKSLGYAEQAEKRGKYRAGPRLESWRSAASPTAKDLLTAFYQEAAHQAGPETLALVAPSESGPLLLAQVEGAQQVRSVPAPGQPAPWLKVAALALQAEPPELVRANGFSFGASDDTFDLALPICRDGSRPDAALLLSAPRFRWTEESLLESLLPDLRVLAARLSYQLGAPVYTPYHAQPDSRLQPTSPLSPEQVAAFLRGPWAARLACVRPDGSPHVIPVWQEWDGESFTVIAWQGSQWAGYVLQNPGVSISVDEPWPPLRRVVVRGQALPLNAEDAQVDLNQLLQRMARRYLGHALAAPAGRVEQAFRIRPDSLRGWQGISGPLKAG